VVARKLVSPDMRVQPGQPLVAIVQKGPIWVTANFDEKQIARIKLGQAAYVRVASNPDNVIAGRVAGISPAAILKTPPAAAPGVQEQQTTQKAANVQPATAKKDEAVKEAPKQAAPQPIARTVPVRIEFDPAFQPQSKAVVLPGMSAHVSVKVD
jgi:multidrug resistance efflux pump